MDTGRHIIEIEEKTACPGWARLLAWLDQTLEDEPAFLIGCHVPECQECRERLQFVEQVQRLRELAAHEYGPLPGVESPVAGSFFRRRRDIAS